MSITDSNIRASVWPDELGRWWAVVYYARRRVDFARPAWRVAVDRDHRAERVVRVFDGRLEALRYAESTVGIMRAGAALAIAAGAVSVSTAEALARVQALTRVLCDDPVGLEPGGAP